MTMAAGQRFYQETSFLPIVEQLAWERAIFLRGATVIAERLGFEEWKKEEIARTLENVFRGAISGGKTFDEAESVIEAAVSAAISGN